MKRIQNEKILMLLIFLIILFMVVILPCGKSDNSSMNALTLRLVATVEGSIPRFSPDGRFIVTQNDPLKSNKNITTLWETMSGKLLFSLERRFEGFSPDGRFITVSHDFGNELELREIPGNKMIRSWKGSVSYSPDSKLMAAVTWENGLPYTQISETVTGNLAASFNGEFRAFSGNGQYAAIQTHDDADKTFIWEARRKRPLRFVEGKFITCSYDGQLLATRAKALAKIWETVTGQLLASVECWGKAYFSPNGLVIATEVYDYKRNAKDTVIKLWESRTGRFIASIDGEIKGPGSLANGPFSIDGKFIATNMADCGGTKLYEAVSGKLIHMLKGRFNGFSSDGKLLMTGACLEKEERKTNIFQSGNAHLIARLEGYPIDFSPDGKLVLTGVAEDEGYRVWRIEPTLYPEKRGTGLKWPSLEAESTEIGPSGVWEPPNIVWSRMQDECHRKKEEPAFVDCVISIMEKAGASARARAFTKLIKGEGYMVSFREMGKVDIVSAFYPFRANDNGELLLVNGTPQVIYVDDPDNVERIDIRKDPLYPSLKRKFPKLELWGHAEFDTMQQRSGGGQRFVFRMVLLNGCHACEVGGHAHIAFDFDSTGKFLGTKLLGLSKVDREKEE